MWAAPDRRSTAESTDPSGATAIMTAARTDEEEPVADPTDEPEHEQPQEPDPRARLMHEVAEQMDAIETDFGDSYQIGRVITIVEVMRPDGNVELRLRAGQYPWVAIGMLDWAKKSLEAAARGG
jgi:hypothetical protein